MPGADINAVCDTMTPFICWRPGKLLPRARMLAITGRRICFICSRRLRSLSSIMRCRAPTAAICLLQPRSHLQFSCSPRFIRAIGASYYRHVIAHHFAFRHVQRPVIDEAKKALIGSAAIAIASAACGQSFWAFSLGAERRSEAASRRQCVGGAINAISICHVAMK